MAPEQARGVKLDRRADLFAMGIVLWETLAFKRLFKGEGEADTLNRVLYEPIPHVCAIAPQVPAELGDIVMKALEREPNARFATAQAFAEALEAVARKLNLLATPKDVAAAVDQVIGTEIEAQREQVRAWIANSEPSQNTRSAHPESITRIEGRSPPGEEDSMPDGSDPRLAGKPPSGRSLPSSDVSSVSSAVIQVPPPRVPGLSERPSQIPEARQRKVWAVVLPLVFVLGLGGGLGVVRLRGGSARNGGGPVATASAGPLVPGATSATAGVGDKPLPVPAAEPAKTAEPGSSASTTPAETEPVKKGKPVPRPVAGSKPIPKPGVQPERTGPAPAVPDDISINPYR
jgi:serine/threonine-protein kinase